MSISTDPEVVEALARSSLGGLPGDMMNRLIDGAVLQDIAAGATTSYGGDPPFMQLVVKGLVRAYVSAPSGRAMTIRYCRPGALMGTGTLFNDSRPPARGITSALVSSRILKLQLATVRALAETDIRVSRAFLRETSARVAEYINELEASSFASSRQRLARHLLDLAADQQTGPRLVALVSQEELATMVGTVREIVVRILRDMRAEGLVHTSRGRVEILDPSRLEAETYGHERAF